MTFFFWAKLFGQDICESDVRAISFLMSQFQQVFKTLAQRHTYRNPSRETT